MTPNHRSDVAVVDETVEVILDTGNALCEVLADSMPFEELDALLRELASEILDTYHAVVDDLDTQPEGAHR